MSIKYLKGTGVVAIALVSGLIGLALVFTDIGPSDTLAGRTTASALFFAVAGLVLGLMNPHGRGWLLSGLAAWGMVALGVVGVAVSISDPVSGDLGLALTFLAGPLLCALTGGLIGAKLARAHLERSTTEPESGS
jgi:peptidoglycan/LPS O-acetylase OafA/YrhL